MSRTLRCQKGQITVEAVLIFAIVASVTIAASRTIKSQNWAAELTRSPWALIAGMTEAGVWRDKKDAIKEHPNKNIARRLSIKGEPEDVPE